MIKALSILKKLNKRDRYITYGVIGILGLLMVSQFIVNPFFENKNRTRKNLSTKLAMLQEMQQWQSEYEALKNNTQISKSRFTRRSKGFTLFKFLDNLAGQAGIKDRIIYMKPSKTIQKDAGYQISRVEMKLDGISLEQLAAYLYGVETSENMVDIKKLSLTKKDKKQGLISAVMRVEAIEI